MEEQARQRRRLGAERRSGEREPIGDGRETVVVGAQEAAAPCWAGERG
jgi:hypothetical protein